MVLLHSTSGYRRGKPGRQSKDRRQSYRPSGMSGVRTSSSGDHVVEEWRNFEPAGGP